jgi:SAM-dependent methyltransferase
MESDGSWQVEILTARFALGIKLDEVGGVDSGWGDPFVFNRSVGGNNAQGVFVDPSEWYKPAYEPELVPPANVMRGEGVDTLEEWFRWGEEWSMALKVYAGLTTKSRAFEIGCGLGRIAFPLRFQLLNGTYDGLDFYPHKIDFLRRRFQSRYPNFCFHHAESPRHNGSHSDLKFGFPDASFDTVYAASIFTSLKPDAAREYLREISRVLDPHGRAAIGVFILDHYDPRRARPLGFARPQFNFDHFPDRAHRDFAVSDPKTPAPLTAFTQNALLGFAAEAGLTLAEPCIPGLWSASSEKFRLAEDLLIFRHSG